MHDFANMWLRLGTVAGWASYGTTASIQQALAVIAGEYRTTLPKAKQKVIDLGYRQFPIEVPAKWEPTTRSILHAKYMRAGDPWVMMWQALGNVIEVNR